MSAEPRIPLRRLAEFNPAPPAKLRCMGQDEIRLLPMDAVQHFDLPGPGVRRTVREVLQGYTYVEPEDVAYAKVTPCFENGKGVVGRDLDGPVFATSELTVIRPGPNLDQGFLSYVLRSEAFRGPAIASMTGAGGLKRVDEKDMASQRIWCPPLAEQRAIADSLDRETAEIDAFISDLERMLVLAEERIEARWYEEYSSLALNWASVQVRRLVTSLVDGPFGSALTSSSYSDAGSPVVRLGNIRRNQFSLDPRVYVPDDYARKLRNHAVAPGDVVIAGLGDDNYPLGRAAVVPEEFGSGIVKADCYRARPGDEVLPEYLSWCLSSPQMGEKFQLAGRGSTRARLNLQLVASQRVPLPSKQVQGEVVDRHHRLWREHEDLTEEVRAAVGIARERRAALISAAVTGERSARDSRRTVAEQLEHEIREMR